MRHGGLRFDCRVGANGYVWWYLDALSADGAYGITLIAFIGSVFSPYYAWARRRGSVDPSEHCALNVALYGPRGARWCMTERGAAQLSRDAAHFRLGRSTLAWNADALDIEVNEICAPIPRRIKGSIRLVPEALGTESFYLDAAGRHRWTPFGPRAHVEVSLQEPALQWSGTAYLDSNDGVEPLEIAFREWTWSRASAAAGTAVLYDVRGRETPPLSMALTFDRHAAARTIEPPASVMLPRTGWRLPRRTRADPAGARVVRTLEDAPFYSRSLLETTVSGMRGPAIHESLDLDRFRSPWVQCLLPFRMPRRIL